MLRDIEKELGFDEVLAIEGSLVEVRVETRRYGKAVTVLTGFDPGVDVHVLAKRLKHALGTGGTAKDGAIELQGDHARAVREVLARDGFNLA